MNNDVDLDDDEGTVEKLYQLFTKDGNVQTPYLKTLHDIMTTNTEKDETNCNKEETKRSKVQRVCLHLIITISIRS